MSVPTAGQGLPSFRDVQLDRQVLTEEEATSSRLLACVVQGVGREAGLSLAVGGAFTSKSRRRTSTDSGWSPCGATSSREAIVHPSAPATQTRSGVDSLFQCGVAGRAGAEGDVDPRGLAGADPRRHDDHLGLDEPLLVPVDQPLRIGLNRGRRLGKDVADAGLRVPNRTAPR